MASIIGFLLFSGSARTGGLATPTRQSIAIKRVPATFFFIAAGNFFLASRPKCGGIPAQKKSKCEMPFSALRAGRQNPPAGASLEERGSAPVRPPHNPRGGTGAPPRGGSSAWPARRAKPSYSRSALSRRREWGGAGAATAFPQMARITAPPSEKLFFPNASFFCPKKLEKRAA